MNNLIICNTQINRDDEGRFCLNDLHRASGGDQRHRPKYWLENKQTIELIEEISKGGITPIFTKQGLGTFVSKELVYAYAMWISAKFNLLVIRAYDSLMKAPAQFALPKTFSEALRLAAQIEEEKARVEGQLAIAAPKANALDLISAAEGDMNVTNTAKVLKIQPKVLFAYLSRNRWIYKNHGTGAWIGYQERVQSGLINHSECSIKDAEGNVSKVVPQVRITPKGLAKLGVVFGNNNNKPVGG